MLQPKPTPTIESLIDEIRSMTDPLADLIEVFRDRIENFETNEPTPMLSGKYWLLAAHTDALVRIRIFTEQNFKYIETLGLLSVTRYLFELLVWLKLLRKDERYGLVYYYEYYRKCLSHQEDVLKHLTREVEFLRRTAAKEEALDREVMSRTTVATSADAEYVLKSMQKIMDDIDDEVDRKFTIYGDDARRNGYALQAHLIETKAMPAAEEAITQIKDEFKVFETLPKTTRDLFPKGKSGWRWREKATLVGLEDEYDFIYTYTSRLLHATPAGLATNMKNLDASEMKMLLRYCRVRIQDIIELSTDILEVVRPVPLM